MEKSTITKPRKSNIELLRLFSMFLIVWYHMFLFVLEPDNPEHPIFKAILMPIHAGVPIFVMISGYFGIRFSFKSLASLLARVYLYVIPLTLIFLWPKHPSTKDIIETFLVLGNNNLWFVNTYLCLYIIAPLLKPFDTLAPKHRWVILAGLAFMSIYVGDVKLSDPSLVNGKNLLNFIFLYLIGSMIRIYSDKLSLIPTKLIIPAYVLVAIIPTVSYLIIGNDFITTRIWMLSFPYNSPILIFSCMIIMILFTRITLQSDKINWISSSVFAIYLIHAASWDCIADTLKWIETINTDSVFLSFTSFALTLGVMAVCISIDKVLSPIWTYVSKKAQSLDKWYSENSNN